MPASFSQHLGKCRPQKRQYSVGQKQLLFKRYFRHAYSNPYIKNWPKRMLTNLFQYLKKCRPKMSYYFVVVSCRVTTSYIYRP